MSGAIVCDCSEQYLRVDLVVSKAGVETTYYGANVHGAGGLYPTHALLRLNSRLDADSNEVDLIRIYTQHKASEERSFVAHARDVKLIGVSAPGATSAAVASMTPTKVALLESLADGAEHSPWDFGAGTLSWAKKSGYVELLPGSPRRYKITGLGRAIRLLVPPSLVAQSWKVRRNA